MSQIQFILKLFHVKAPLPVLVLYSGLSNSLGKHHGVRLQGPAEDWGVPLIYLAVCTWYCTSLFIFLLSKTSSDVHIILHNTCKQTLKYPN